MNRSAFVVPVGLIVLSAATRAGLWLVVVGSASVVVMWLYVRWQVRRWYPVAIALWVVADDSAEGRHAAHVAGVSFGDRRALRVAAGDAPIGAACVIEAAVGLMDLVAVPGSTRPRRRTLVVWCSVAVGAVFVSGVTGSTMWLAVAVFASTAAVVAWSWWRLVTRTRPDGVLVAATTPDAVCAVPVVVASELLSRSSRPGAVFVEAARVLERADLPLCERNRAALRLIGLRPSRDRRSVTPVAAVQVLALFGVVVPWIAW